MIQKQYFKGTSLAVEWLTHHTSIARGMGSSPGQGTKIPQAMWCGQKEKEKKERKKH